MNRHLATSDTLPLFLATNNVGHDADANRLHDIAVRAVSNGNYKKTKPPIAEWADAWMKSHPAVYPLFVRFALQIVSAGRKKFSAKAIVERLRWETAVQGGKDFKIANAVTTYLARRFMIEYPEHAELFFRGKRGGAQ